MKGTKISCARPDDQRKLIEFSIEQLVVVKRFGEAIYPTLVPVEKVARGADKPWHILINGENFHALQLLLYAHEGIQPEDHRQMKSRWREQSTNRIEISISI